MPSATTHKTTASPSALMTSLACSRIALPSLTHSMKLTISQADLNAALRTIARAIPTRATHPILTGVLLTASDGSLQLTGYDLDLGIETTITAATDTPGSTVVPYRLLSDIVSRLDGADAITLAVDGARVTLTAAAGSYSLSVATADDYPDLPVVTTTANALVDLTAALGAVLPACSTDAAKQLLTGVHITADGTTLRLEATDGHRLCIRTMRSDLPVIDCTIPSRTLQLVRQPVAIAIDKAHASLTLPDGTRIISRILDGTYPNAAALVPSSFKASLAADRSQLLHALERVAVIADQHNSVVKLEASSKAIKVSAEAETNSGVESIAATGKLPTLAANVHYLIDGLKAFDDDTITINANEPTTPLVMAGADASQTYLVMPVQVRS